MENALKKLRLLLVGLVVANNCYAVDFGKYGNSFPVVEEGFVKMMKRKLANIDMEKEREKMEQISKERVNNPAPVAGVVPAKVDREFYFDPTYILPEDVVLPDGKVLYPAGTTVNPLDNMDLERRLFFVDSRRPEQIKWLKRELAKYIVVANDNSDTQVSSREISNNSQSQIQNKVILVAGSVLKLQEIIKEEVYFDQMGELTTKFGIKASPAIAEQEGKQIRIQEISLKEGEANEK
jgi:conjugal transfer pilus assembly protein TraW